MRCRISTGGGLPKWVHVFRAGKGSRPRYGKTCCLHSFNLSKTWERKRTRPKAATLSASLSTPTQKMCLPEHMRPHGNHCANEHGLYEHVHNSARLNRYSRYHRSHDARTYEVRAKTMSGLTDEICAKKFREIVDEMRGTPLPPTWTLAEPARDDILGCSGFTTKAPSPTHLGTDVAVEYVNRVTGERTRQHPGVMHFLAKVEHQRQRRNGFRPDISNCCSVQSSREHAELNATSIDSWAGSHIGNDGYVPQP